MTLKKVVVTNFEILIQHLALGSERSYVEYAVGYCIVMFHILSVLEMICKHDVLGTVFISSCRRLVGCPYRPLGSILLFPLFFNGHDRVFEWDLLSIVSIHYLQSI
jgi:hypothetical protein